MQSSELRRFGPAGLPLHQFELGLRYGYRVHFSLWENRSQMLAALDGSLPPDLRKSDKLMAATTIEHGRVLACSHFAVTFLTDELIHHEIGHAFWEYRERIAKRYRVAHNLEEAIVTEGAKAFVVVRRHLRREMRRV